MVEQQSFKDSIKNFYYDSRIYLKYGTTSPEVISLPFTNRSLSIDPDDPRARKKLIIKSGLRGRTSRNQLFWQTAIQEFRPQTVLDIGFNYGECMLSTTYEPGARLFAFEANQGLEPYIEQSLSKHPNQEQIECHFKLVSDTIEETDFWVDKEWSGCSSAARPNVEQSPEKYEKKSVASVTIDHVLKSSHCDQEKLFFKLDVEGYEYRVLLGMQETIEQTQEILGFVEFDPTLLRRAGENVHEYWDFLRNQFNVYAFEKDGDWRSYQHLDMLELEFLCGDKFHTDLLLIKSDSSEEINVQLQSAWKQLSTRKFAA
ncbi:MAG: FkbM family methyltransferase [Planctomicrobium sp.]|jgi:FkbM family methyltransferase|nr:FkbM family methyltransferase [Planctomicrobium sp.]